MARSKSQQRRQQQQGAQQSSSTTAISDQPTAATTKSKKKPTSTTTTTTTTKTTSKQSTTKPSSSSQNNTNHEMDDTTYARYLYEIRGDAHSSLRAHIRVWLSAANAHRLKNEKEDETASVRRRHDRAILSHLASLLETEDDGGGGSKKKEEEEKSREDNLITQLNALRDETFTTLLSSSSSGSSSSPKQQQQQQQQDEGKKNALDGTASTVLTAVNALVTWYNLALSYFVSGNPKEGANVLLPLCCGALRHKTLSSSSPSTSSSSSTSTPAASSSSSSPSPPAAKEDSAANIVVPKECMLSSDVYMWSCRISFLLLDCMIASSRGNLKGIESLIYYPDGIAPPAETKKTKNDATSNNKKGEKKKKTVAKGIVVTPDDILNHIEDSINEFATAITHTSSSITTTTSNNISVTTTTTKDQQKELHELKFRLCLYRSRVIFAKSSFLSSSSSSTNKNKEDGGGGENNDKKKKKAPLVMKLDSKIRQSRKELKSALEIYHHKLVPPKIDTTTPSSSNVDDGKSVGSKSDVENTLPEQSQAATTGLLQEKEKVMINNNLDARNQCALYLKANLEHLRGNARKSLILCAEARLAGEGSGRGTTATTTTSTTTAEDLKGQEDNNQESEEEAEEEEEEENEAKNQRGKRTSLLQNVIHNNNLGVLHQSSGKVHVALYYYARALSSLEHLSFSSTKKKDNSGFANDGTAEPTFTSEVLHNAATCAFMGGNLLGCYECMSKCVGYSVEVFGKRGKCWLRMAECCIGLHAALTQKKKNGGMSIPFKPAMNGIVVDLSNNSYDPPKQNKLVKTLGSEEDIKQVSSNPLPRALFCLEQALRLCSAVSPIQMPIPSIEDEETDKGKYDGKQQDNDISDVNGTSLPATASSPKLDNNSMVDEDCLEATRTALAYVKLEMNDPVMALQLSRFVLSNPLPTAYEKNENSWTRAVSLRRRATVRMYACEALCRIGNAKDAMNFMLHPNEDTNENSKVEEGEDAGNDKKKLEMKTMNDLAALTDLARDLAMLSTRKNEPSGSNSNDRGDENTTTAGSAPPTAMEKIRLDEARIATQVTASGAAASAGDLQTASRFAALAFQHATSGAGVSGPLTSSSSVVDSTSRGNRSSSGTSIMSKRAAKRALMYCLLGEGDNESALAVLRSGP